MIYIKNKNKKTTTFNFEDSWKVYIIYFVKRELTASVVPYNIIL